MTEPTRLKKKPPVLSPGDTLEFSLTLSENYQTVRSGATTTIREGETPEQAQARLEHHVVNVATRMIDELA